MKKVITLSLSLLMMMMIPINALAAATEWDIIESNESMTIKRNAHEMVLEDHLTGEITRGIINGDGTMTIIEPDGDVLEAHRDNESGNVYLDGELIYEEDKTTVLRQPFAVPSGFTLLTSHKGHVSQINDSNSACLGILGLVPWVGPIFAIIAMFDLAKEKNLNKIYFVKTQYYRKSDYAFYDVMKFYKYSSYTGLVDSTEYGPFYSL